MNSNSRTINAINNTYIGILAKVISIILSFITRTVFIRYLSTEYLGLNGLFTNILAVLSLAELGFAGAIAYHLYEPIAYLNEDMISSLINFYKKVYQIMGCIIGLAGICALPLIHIFITDGSKLKDFNLIYFLFLTESIMAYFFAHIRSIISADQREHILSKYRMLFNLIKAVLQIAIIIHIRSYIGFLLLGILCSLFEHCIISYRAGRLYPFIKKKRKLKLDKEHERRIWRDVKSLAIYKTGGTILNSTDNIMISAFSGLISMGYLSNYNMIIGAVEDLVSQFSYGITAGVGNFIVKESSKKQEELLYKITFINFMLYGFAFVCLYCCLNPFIELWIGTRYILDSKIVFIICLNNYINCMLISIWTYRSAMGLFKYGKYRPLISSMINIALSILLGIRMGVLGVLLGTMITRLITNAWFDPWIVFHYGLKSSVINYYIRQLRYFGVIVIDIIITEGIFHHAFNKITLTGLFMKFIICTLVVIISFLLFIKTEELRFIISSAKRLIYRQKSYDSVNN